MAVTIERESAEYLKARVESDVSPVGTPKFAFTLVDTDARPAEFVDGAWLGAAVAVVIDGVPMFRRWARTSLVGPGGTVLAPGEYFGWIKNTDAPEVPVMKCGRVIVD